MGSKRHLVWRGNRHKKQPRKHKISELRRKRVNADFKETQTCCVCDRDIEVGDDAYDVIETNRTFVFTHKGCTNMYFDDRFGRVVEGSFIVQSQGGR